MSQNKIQLLLQRIISLRNRALDSQINSIFWADFINVVLMVSNANKALVLEWVNDESARSWQPINIATQDSLNDSVDTLDAIVLEQAWFNEFATRSMQNKFALHKDELAQPLVHYLSFQLYISKPTILVIQVTGIEQTKLADLVMKVQLLVDVPRSRSTSDSVNNNTEELKGLLSILPSIYSVGKFDLVSYALVNEFVSHSAEVDQAIFGVVKDEYTRIQAISHFDRFENKTDLAKLYEAALEECTDQNTVIHFAKPEAGLINLAHDQLQKALGAKDLISFPLYDEKGKAFSALLFVNMDRFFTNEFIHTTDFVLSLISDRIQDLMIQQLAWWRRLKIKTADFLSILFGKEWLWTKFFTAVIFLLILWILFGSLPLRLEAKGQFETDQTIMVGAPQDGYIVNVAATAGELVEEEQVLIRLKTEELLLQMSEFLAEKQRYEAEEDKARATSNFIDVEIAKARKAQVEAKIARLELKLNESEIRAPFTGIIIEGERKDLLGAPVKQGDKLMRLAKIEGIYLVMEVDERDIPLVRLGDQGEFALVSQPLNPIEFVIEQIIPSASDAGKGNAHFRVKGRLLATPAEWWRPGMIGVAKIDKGDYSVYWVLGRKTYHQLRLMFWW